MTRRFAVRASALILASALLVGLHLWYHARAAGATLSFSPASGTYAVGKTFTVRVVLDSGGGVGVNASDGTVSFDPKLLAVAGVSKDGSIFSLWTSDPGFSNTAGTVTWSGGTPSAYTQSAGAVVTITFRAVTEGTATVKFTAASVLAADGQGTDVYGGGSDATYTLSGSAPPPAETTPPPSSTESPPTGTSEPGVAPGLGIEITSPTHPDPDTWYSNNSPEFKWDLQPDIDSVSTDFDTKPTTAPPRASEGLIETQKYDNVADGEHYFHIRFHSRSTGWSAPIHRRALVDTTPPETFSADIDQPDKGLPPTIVLRATDSLSGVANYRVQIDDRDPATIAPRDIPDGRYPIPPILPGTYQLSLSAIDHAGNEAKLSREIRIEGTDHVDITQAPGFLEEQQPLILQGTADGNAHVSVKVETQGKILFEDSTNADQNGAWTLVTRKAMKKGDYQISAKMVTRAGAESDYSEKLDLVVTGAPFINQFGWFLVVLLLMAAFGLSLYVMYLRRQAEEKRLALMTRTDEVRQQAEAIFSALDEEIEEKIQLMDEETATKLGMERMSALDVVEKIKEALDISQDTLNKEIQDVKDELG